MDQEKFDQHLMGYLFDELDEVTSAAMKRKIESDADCRDLALGLRATLDVAQLPIEEPSDDLEERILSAASLAEQGEPWSRKLLRSLSWAGSHAMRPQLAMAAMLVLVVGSSLLLLRVRTGAVAVTPTKERGSGVVAGPGPEHSPPPTTGNDDLAPLPLAEGDQASVPSAASSASTAAQPKLTASGAPLDDEQLAILDKQFDQAMANYNKGAHLEAQRDFASIKATKSPRAGSAALFEARAVRAHSGCKAAVPYFNSVRSLGGAMAADATWEQADCHRILGESAQAKKLYLALQNDKGYGARVAKELESQGETANSGGDGSSTRQRNSVPSTDEPEQDDEPKAKPQPSNREPEQSQAPAPQQSTKK